MARIGLGFRIVNNLNMPAERHAFIPTPNKEVGRMEKNTARV